MTITRVQAWIGIITGVLFITITIGGDAIILLRTFEAYDARLAKLENAVKAINAAGPDEKYRQLVKELMAEERPADTPRKAGMVPVYGIKGITNCAKVLNGCTYPDMGASADAPATKPPQ